MKTSFLASVALVLSIVLCGCANAPGRELAASTPIVPNEISDFNVLYGENCAGCHGTDGRGGAAIPLGDPVYLAIADDTIMRRAATNGIPGTSMPAFAQSAGGMLTEKQIDLIVHGIRERWSQPNVLKWHEPAAVRVHRLRATLRAARRFTGRSARLATAWPAKEGRRQVPSWMDLFSRCLTIRSCGQS